MNVFRDNMSAALLMLILGACIGAGGASARTKNVTVRIEILSKHLRLIREGKEKEISFSLSRGTSLRSADGRVSGFRRLRLFRYGGVWHVNAGAFARTAPFSLKLSGANNCRLTTPVRGRIYPLPMEITCGIEGPPRIVVTEGLRRYAGDAARAEYGPLRHGEYEAAAALGEIIHARYYVKENIGRHNGFDFCDLTHCHVYRGRLSLPGPFSTPWHIKWKGLPGNLFYHARCGGHTLNESVFSLRGRRVRKKGRGVIDRLYRSGRWLCRGPGTEWQRNLPVETIDRILFSKRPGHLHSFDYSEKESVIRLTRGERTIRFAPEDFRLRINRVMGWSFIRSNLYTVMEKVTGAGRSFLFRGEGLGHGVGFCQMGALTLSRLGYSRYEILKHYFPGIGFIEAKGESAAYTPYISFVIYDIREGKVLSLHGSANLLKRRVPPGSIFKLVTSLYLAAERPDIFNHYTYTCTGKNREDPLMPDHCWDPAGHGRLTLAQALPLSCNLYFASLYKKISMERFKRFFITMHDTLHLEARLPKLQGPRRFSCALAGLDFYASFTVKDLITLTRLISPERCASPGIMRFRERIGEKKLRVIYRALKETFRSGTASGRVPRYGTSLNYLPFIRKDGRGLLPEMYPDVIAGKTSTVIAGTNRPVSCGIFTGARGRIGITTILYNGNGHLAALWAQRVLEDFSRNGKTFPDRAYGLHSVKRSTSAY